MKKKILIVIADYYKNISLNLIKSAKDEIKNFYNTKTITVPGVFEIQLLFLKILKNMMDL